MRGARRDRRMVASSLSSLLATEGVGERRVSRDPVSAKRGVSGEAATGLDLVESRRIERRSRANAGLGKDDWGDKASAGISVLSST